MSHLEEIEKQDFFLISSETLKELENIKISGNKTDAVRYNSRKAVRFLDKNEDKYKVIMYDAESTCDFNTYRLEDTPDTRIIRCAEYAKDELGYKNLVFYTNDLLCKRIAKEYFKLNVDGVSEGESQIYKGYRLIRGTTKEINEFMSDMDYTGWNVNEYLIIENSDDGSVKEMRFDGETFVALKLPSSRYIKAKNPLQRCALDILNNPDITVAAILGGYGSGKTYLSMQMALYNVQEKGRASKILGVREVIGEGKEIGFLPGDMENKIGLFFDPLRHSLNGGEFELESLKQSGVLDVNIPFFMKGTTYNNTIIICDEAEDLTESQIRLIGTRLGNDSTIYLAGDYKQSLLQKTINNPLIKMCSEFKGNKKFGCIYLGEDVRSETSKMFAELFE